MHQRRPLRVLIIGQQNNFGQILATNVRRWGYEAIVLPSTVAMLTGKAYSAIEEDMQADVILYDLDEAYRISTLLGSRDTPTLLGRNGHQRWPSLPLVIAMSSCSVSRRTLEQLEAVSLLYKPFEMGRLQRNLRILQKLFFPEPDDELPAIPPPDNAMHARILVVDDDIQVARAIRQCLEEETPYQVAIAQNGIEALEQYISWHPHCIVTDLIMPWMNGYQVMRCLMAASLPTVPTFVVVSALTHVEVPLTHSYLNEHVAAYVDKPFHIDHLLTAVDQALHNLEVPLQAHILPTFAIQCQ